MTVINCFLIIISSFFILNPLYSQLLNADGTVETQPHKVEEKLKVRYYTFRGYYNHQWIFSDEIFNLATVVGWYNKVDYNNPSGDILNEFYVGEDDLSYRCFIKEDGYTIVKETIFLPDNKKKQYIYYKNKESKFVYKREKNEDGTSYEQYYEKGTGNLLKTVYYNKYNDISHIIFFGNERLILREEFFNSQGKIIKINTYDDKIGKIVYVDEYNPNSGDFERKKLFYNTDYHLYKKEMYENEVLVGIHNFNYRNGEWIGETYKDIQSKKKCKVTYYSQIEYDKINIIPQPIDFIPYSEVSNTENYYKVFTDEKKLTSKIEIIKRSTIFGYIEINYDELTAPYKIVEYNIGNKFITHKYYNEIESELEKEPEKERKHFIPLKGNQFLPIKIERYNLSYKLFSFFFCYYKESGELQRVEVYDGNKKPVFRNYYIKGNMVLQQVYEHSKLVLLKEYSSDGDLNSQFTPGEESENFYDYVLIKEIPVFGSNPHAKHKRPQSLDQFISSVKKENPYITELYDEDKEYIEFYPERSGEDFVPADEDPVLRRLREEKISSKKEKSKPSKKKPKSTKEKKEINEENEKKETEKIEDEYWGDEFFEKEDDSKDDEYYSLDVSN